MPATFEAHAVIDNDNGQPVVTTADLDGVRTARVIGFFIDYAIVFILCIPFGIILALAGVLTFGLAWGLFPFLVPAVALLYLAVTMGGEKQSTIGMRMMGVRIYQLSGQPVGPILAMLHGLLFWFIHFTVFLLLVTFFSSKKRLLHDILLGTYVARG